MAIKNLSNWIGILGLAVGVVGIGMSYHYYSISVRERKPLFVPDPDRTLLIDSRSIGDSAIRITRLDGSVIEGSISSARFYFWNGGRLPIRPEHILKPIVVSLEGQNAEILDYKILKVSRPDIVAPRVSMIKDGVSRLGIDFQILDHGDGFSVQLTFSGSPDAPLVISGAVEGAAEIGDAQAVARGRFWEEYGITIGATVLVILFIVLGAAGIDRAFEKGEELYKWSSAKITFTQKLLYYPMSMGLAAAKGALVLMGIGLLFVIVYALTYGGIKKAEEKALESVVSSVPESIMPPR